MGYMYNDSAIFITGSCALSQSAYVSWGSATGSDTDVGFFQNNNGTLMFKDHTTGSWTELGNTRDNTQLGDAAADIVTANGQLTASQGISATLNSKFDENVILGSAADDIITVNGQLTASQGISATLNSKFDANVTLGNAAADITTVTGQLTASQGISAALNSQFDENVILGSAADDIITVNGQLTASQGITATLNSQFDENVRLGSAGDDIISVNGQLTASQGISATLNSNFDANVTLGNAVTDVTTATGQLTASVGAIIASGKKLKLGADEEYLKGDGTDIHFGVGTGGDINIPANIGLTFGDDGEKIESDGTNLTIASGGDIILSPTGNDILPPSDNTVNLGSGAKRWANVYTADLHLKNDRGDWTIVEEKDYICVVNNSTQKRYKMMLEEIEE